MNFIEATQLAHRELLASSSRNFILGLGVNYPNGADGSTKGLAAEFPQQVLDSPTSELALSGCAVGMASQGLRPIVHHGRVEFSLLALDQILTQASRWEAMFGGNYPCPVTFRICIGRQWGNGPQHTANYHSIFLQSPGLTVYIPSTPLDIYRAIKDSNTIDGPAVILEHRWLYKTTQTFPVAPVQCHLPSCTSYGTGTDYSILTYGDGLIDSLMSHAYLQTQGICGKVLCIKKFSQSANPGKIFDEISQACGRIVFVDTAPFRFGLLAGMLGGGIASGSAILPRQAKVVAPPFVACPTSPLLVEEYYPNVRKIVSALNECGLKAALPKSPSFDELNMAPSFSFDSHIGKDFF